VPRTGRVLVVDDEVNARTTLADLLRDEGFEVEIAADAFKGLGKYETFLPHVVVTDLQMPGMDGIEMVKKIRAYDEPAAVLVMTAFGAVPSAVEAMRAGAADYLTKPLDFDELLVVLDRVFEIQHLRLEARQLRARIAPGNLIGAAPAMQKIFQMIEQVAASRATVLVTGEAGTGKQMLARAIHQASPRSRRPFVTLHCAGLAEAELAQELFGAGTKDGRIAHAHGGTLFLDEVSELPPTIQVRLLRYLQDHELERVAAPVHIDEPGPRRGNSGDGMVDTRVIASTRADLPGEVAAGRFRGDLYYRLNVIALAVPPLRARTVDIPALAKMFLHKYAKANDKAITDLASDALEALVTYMWPGNVRELESAIESAVVLTTGSVLEARALPANVQPSSGEGLPRIPGSTMAELERYAILETLRATGGSTSKAAEILGISTRTVQYRLHEYHEAQRSGLAVARKPDK
jgi:DNA-binding NtrC family response regulator